MQKKSRICTTISSKHAALLNELAQEYGTQQKVLETALENLVKAPKPSLPLAPEDELFIRFSSEVKSLCVIQKEGFKLLLETVDMERFAEFSASNRPVEFLLEYMYRKPLKECTLKEVVEGSAMVTRMTRFYDTTACQDCGDYYLLTVTHNMGLNNSKTYLVGSEIMFKTYGARIESKITDCSVFIKIFKDGR